MAKTVYVNWKTGDNSNDGLSPSTAKKTIVAARDATLAGDLVLIEPGVYPEGDVTFSSANDQNVVYMPDPSKNGLVIVDFENKWGSQADASNWNVTANPKPLFLNIIFRNPSDAGTMLRSAQCHHCVIYQRDLPANTGAGIRFGRTRNCTFYNLNFGDANADDSEGHFNSYFENVTTALNSAAGPHDFNAFPGNGEANGIDTNSVNPGLRDPANDDFRLANPGTAAWDTFMNGGQNAGRVGAFGRGGLYYNHNFPQLRFLSQDPTSANGNPLPLWENEGPSGTNTYTEGTPGDIIEDSSTFELKIDLTTTPGATGGRVRSDVFDLGTATPLTTSAALQRFEDIVNGAAIDLDTTLPQQMEWRHSSTTFAKGDGSPSWVAFDLHDFLNSTDQFVQFRIEFRTDHTNA